jgi:hypothetical protein
MTLLNDSQKIWHCTSPRRLLDEHFERGVVFSADCHLPMVTQITGSEYPRALSADSLEEL